MNQATTQAPRRPRTNAAGRKAASRDRCTLCLDPLTSMKLSIEAHRKGLDRSDVVNHILAEALRHIVISVREHSPSSANPAGDVSQGAGATVAA